MFIKDYFYTYSSVMKEIHQGYYVRDEIQIIANGIEFIVNLLYVIIYLFANWLGSYYQSSGYSIDDCDR